MNFFEAQDRAKRASRRLVIAYIIATALIVLGVVVVVGGALYLNRPTQSINALVNREAPFLLTTGVITLLFILGASVYKTASLSAGGGRVAEQLGGTQVATDTTDFQRRRLRNVVEEMSIASGVPVPDIYVLDRESGINAFAAGYAPGDAAIAVTRGALDRLERDELQGVIAHEFSHVLNGDMRLNIRLMGVLFGILALGLVGRMILRGSHRTSIASSNRGRGAPVALAIGAGLALLGMIGLVAARIIKAAVSRQREQLADASAVQFTRQTEGLANALKKIGGFAEGSYLTATDPEEVSHMLFGSGMKLSGLFATHPPIVERIRALDPSFSEQDFDRIRAEGLAPAAAAVDSRSAGFAPAAATGISVTTPADIAETVGNPDIGDVEYARMLRPDIPDDLYDAAHSDELAWLLALALVLDRDGKSLGRQMDLLAARIGEARTRRIGDFRETLAQAPAEVRLPLLEIAFPAIRHRPEAQLRFLVDLAGKLINIDDRFDLYEYCFYRVLRANLDQSLRPRARQRRARRRDLRKAALDLVSLVARHGHSSPESQRAAFAAGTAELGAWARDAAPESAERDSVQTLDDGLDTLAALNPENRRRLVRALAAAAAHDAQITAVEADLIRAVCAALECPLPPMLVNRRSAAGRTGTPAGN